MEASLHALNPTVSNRESRPTVDGACFPELARPLLSFIMVNWNYGRFIGQAIDSIKRQTYSCFECIIVDNGSSDNSLAVIEQHIGPDARFRVIRLPENRGQLGGAFTGLREASGPFVAIVDADDTLLPSFAATHIQVHLALKHNVAVTSSNVIEVTGEGEALSSTHNSLRLESSDSDCALRDERLVVRLQEISESVYRQDLMKQVAYLPRNIEGWVWSPGTSNVLRRSVAELFVVPGDSTRMRGADNYFLPLCHAFAGTAAIDLPLSTRRVHGTNYFANREELPSLRTGSEEIFKGMENNSLENLEIVLQQAPRHAWLLGKDFWCVIDQLTERRGVGRRRFYRRPNVIALFHREAPQLLAAVGAPSLTRNLRSRFGFRHSVSILRAAFKGPIPMRHWPLLWF